AHEELAEILQHLRLRFARGIEADVDHGRLEELARIEQRIHHPRHGGVAVESAEQRLQHRRFSRPDRAGHDYESGVGLDAVAQVAERLLVAAARIEVIGIGRQRERPLAEAIEAFIHVSLRYSPPAGDSGIGPGCVRRRPRTTTVALGCTLTSVTATSSRSIAGRTAPTACS